MKKCFKCGEEKALAAFYKHPNMGDGHLNKCKECTKKDVRENRRKNIGYYRAYDRARGSRADKQYRDRYRAAFPGKSVAGNAVSNAVRDGKLVRAKACSECGDKHEHIHGHHDDYSRPLVVRWLCPPCHFAWHKEHGEAPNGS